MADHLGPEHPDVATDLNNLAELLRATNRLAEAEPLYRQVLRILAEFRHRVGREHPHFRTAINNYAELISAMGLSQDAIAARVRSAIEGEPEESARITPNIAQNVPPFKTVLTRLWCSIMGTGKDRKKHTDR